MLQKIKTFFKNLLFSNKDKSPKKELLSPEQLDRMESELILLFLQSLPDEVKGELMTNIYVKNGCRYVSCPCCMNDPEYIEGIFKAISEFVNSKILSIFKTNLEDNLRIENTLLDATELEESKYAISKKFDIALLSKFKVHKCPICHEFYSPILENKLYSAQPLPSISSFTI